MQIANTILAQLGGNKFIVMTGSKNFAGSSNSLTMKLARNNSGANYLTITLNALDTYDMEFIKFSPKNFTRKVAKKVEGVYCDMLQTIFTKETGLYTSL